MPQLSDNDDGTKTLSVNSSELAPLKNLLHERVPGYKKMLELADSEGVKNTLKFVRSAVE